MLEYLTESLYSRLFWISFVRLKKGKVLHHKDDKVRLQGGGGGGEMVMASLTHKLAEGFVKPSSLFYACVCVCVWGGGGYLLTHSQTLLHNRSLTTNESFGTNYVTSALMTS